MLSGFVRSAFPSWRNHWLRSPLLVTSQHYRLTTPRQLAPATQDPGPSLRAMLLHEEEMPSCVFSSPHGVGFHAGTTCAFRLPWTRGMWPAAPRRRAGVWLNPFRVRRAHLYRQLMVSRPRFLNDLPVQETSSCFRMRGSIARGCAPEPPPRIRLAGMPAAEMGGYVPTTSAPTSPDSTAATIPLYHSGPSRHLRHPLASFQPAI